jgi:amino acid permease
LPVAGHSFYIWGGDFRIQLGLMVKLNSKYRLPFWTAITSFAGLAVLMLSTNPIDKIIYAVFFFGLALIFMISLGHLLVRLQMRTVTPKNRYRIIVISLIILTLLMFRSAQSLNWVDAVILVLISFGLVFYISRRS